MGKTLKEYIEEIRSIPIDESLSDEAVIALMNIHLSVMSMIVANMLEEEYGDAKLHREAMYKLFAVCRKRSTGSQALARCSRMTPAMYNIFYMPDAQFDDRRHTACLTRTFRMADEWRKRTDGPHLLDEKARMTEYGVLQSILEAFVYVVEEDKEADKDYLWLKQRIGDWASGLGDNGGWSGLSDHEAVRRLNIMVGNANTNGDSRFDAQIEKALWYYYDVITDKDLVDCHTLFYLYWALVWGIGCQDDQKIDTLANRAVQMAGSPFVVDRDVRLWYMAVLIDRECVRINKEVKQKMLAYSA